MTPKIWTFLCACLCAGLLAAVPATAAGVGETCSGIAAIRCDAGLACQFPMGQCNVADLSGTCVRVPETCPKNGPPVCGCDGKTYANECELLKAGARPAKKGACGHGDGRGGHGGEMKACTSNADCATGSFCEQKSGVCGGSGACMVKPEVCTEQFDPVCGCDNHTYGNDCHRKMAGVSLKATGECPKM